ncbi:MAG: DedA family protein [Candidatus Polarisedimenticolia bacterium]
MPDWLQSLVDIFLHLDRHLTELTARFGVWTYLILFGIVFCETGLVVTPFLPGDSLLFAAGALAGAGAFDVWVLMGVLIVAAVLGDTVNYQIGHYVGPKVFTAGHSRWFRKEHLDRTHAFFEKYGGKTIVIARFVPIIRTFAPFVAGVGSMTYARFLAYNVVGGVLWVVSFVLAGYWFGSREFVKKNFSLVIVAIIILSILPGVWEYLRARRESAAARR